jgi:serine/threonine-protein kinase
VIASGRFPELDVTLIDFGVAKHEYTARKTLDGSITGKPPYMSPEQCRGESVTDKSDVYSLGILAYVLLTKKPPFSHRNPLRVMKMHQRQDPPPLPDTVPQAVQSLVSQMLSKQPASRPSVGSISKTIRTLEVTA